MKTTLFIAPLIFLTACATDPKPRIVSVPPTIPGRTLPVDGIETIRYSENLKAYPVGRYVDPNSNLVMHEGHTVYRVETTAKWNLHPGKPSAVPMGPPVGVVDPARRDPPVNPEVIAEVNKQKAATQTLIDQGTKINQTISQLSGAFKLTQELGEQNLQLRQELTTTQKRLEALEQELRKQQAEVVFGPNKKQMIGETKNGKEHMLKRNGRPVGANEQNGGGQESPEFRENASINAQIDGYIKENPKHWELIKAMPRERLERTVVWQQIRFNSRKEKMNHGLLKKVEENPDLKRDYENLLKHVPEDQRERAKLTIARTLVLSQSRGEKPPNNAVGA